MDLIKFPAGKDVIRQGEDGDNLYVVESGELTCHRIIVIFLF